MNVSILTFVPLAKQRLGKRIPVTNISIARQRLQICLRKNEGISVFCVVRVTHSNT
jgi:hypothetical protein